MVILVDYISIFASMKKKYLPDISKLKVPAEQYEAESCFNDFPSGFYQMHEIERKFIHGLVRFLKPKRILEIGVYKGGGTAILLNAIKDFKDCKVVSIDLEKGDKIGCFPKKMFSKTKNWKLFDGKDPSEIMGKIGGASTPFDFCVLDTAHIHPIESLNFLTVLHFLSDNAVVVIHDLIEFTATSGNVPAQISHGTCFANKLLFDCLCGTKLKIKDDNYLNSGYWGLPGIAPTSGNIGAVQITKDTKKYIQDVFSMLLFPWGLLPNPKHLKMIQNICKKHYSKENLKEFCYAVNLNLKFIKNRYSYINSNKIEEMSEQIENARNIIFYGAGANCKKLIDKTKESKERMPSEIWDINSNIKNIQGIAVKQPDFTNKEKYKNSVIVITIRDKTIASKVNIRLKKIQFLKSLLEEEYDWMLNMKMYGLY